MTCRSLRCVHALGDATRARASLCSTTIIDPWVPRGYHIFVGTTVGTTSARKILNKGDHGSPNQAYLSGSWICNRTVNPEVAGSSPVAPVTKRPVYTGLFCTLKNEHSFPNPECGRDFVSFASPLRAARSPQGVLSPLGPLKRHRRSEHTLTHATLFCPTLEHTTHRQVLSSPREYNVVRTGPTRAKGRISQTHPDGR